MFKPVPNRVDYVNLEHEVQAWWDANDIPRKYRERNQDADERWSFLDGPITANNPMGVHHAWGRTYKDALPALLRHARPASCATRTASTARACGSRSRSRRSSASTTSATSRSSASTEFVERVQGARRNASPRIQTEQSIRLGYWMDWEQQLLHEVGREQLHDLAFLKKCHERGWLYQGHDVDALVPALRHRPLAAWRSSPRATSEITHTSRSYRRRFPLHRAGPEGERPAGLDDDAVDAAGQRRRRGAPGADLPAGASRRDERRSTSRKGARGDGAHAASTRSLGEVKGAELVGLTYAGPFDELPVAAGRRRTASSPGTRCQRRRGHRHRPHRPGLRPGGLRAVARSTASP